MGNWGRICFSHYLTRTLFQSLKLMQGKCTRHFNPLEDYRFSTTGSAGLKCCNNGRKLFDHFSILKLYENWNFWNFLNILSFWKFGNVMKFFYFLLFWKFESFWNFWNIEIFWKFWTLNFIIFLNFLGNLHSFWRKPQWTGPLWLLPVHYGFCRSIMALKAIMDRKSILEQNNVLAV